MVTVILVWLPGGFRLSLGLSLRLSLGLSFGLSFGLGLRFGFGLGLGLGLGFGLRFGFGLGLGLGFGLGFGLGLGLGLGFGLRFGLGLGLGLSFGLGFYDSCFAANIAGCIIFVIVNMLCTSYFSANVTIGVAVCVISVCGGSFTSTVVTSCITSVSENVGELHCHITNATDFFDTAITGCLVCFPRMFLGSLIT